MNVINIKVKDIKPYDNNPRVISEEAIEKVMASIKEFGFQQPIVVDKDMVIIVGHTRLLASKKLGLKEVPVVIADNLSPEQVRAYRLADNKTGEFSKWEDDSLAFELSALECLHFDMEPFGFETTMSFLDEDEECDTDYEEINEEAEKYLDEAWKNYALEYAKQFEALNGFTGLTKSYAKIKFIDAKYYNKKYPRYCSVIFHKHQFKTPGSKFSAYEGLYRVANNEINIKNLRYLFQNNEILNLYSTSLPFSDSRMPPDFPVHIVRGLIKEFGKKGKILDPCHGWGGRLIGAMLEDVESYTGIDPSPLQNAGVADIYETFKEYSNIGNVSLICKPFEDVELADNYFDFAFTSPPYFDVEKYQGGEQAHVKYNNYELWKDSFYSVLIKNVFKALKEDSFFCLQVGSQKYPLAQDGKQIAESVGFECIEIRDTDMVNTLMKTDKEKGEVILVLHKGASK